MSVTINPDNNIYDLGELRLGTEVIVCESFSVSISTESETKTVTNSRDPVGYKGGKNEYSFSASGVSPEYFDLLSSYQEKRINFPVTVFNFDDDGEYKEMATLMHCRITSIEDSHEDEGSLLDIEGTALSKKRKR